MFTGYSALAMAEALPADGVVVACEIDRRAARVRTAVLRRVTGRARRSPSPSARRWRHCGRWPNAPATIELQAFDLVFIDADKAGYLGYLEVLLDTDLLAPARSSPSTTR